MTCRRRKMHAPITSVIVLIASLVLPRAPPLPEGVAPGVKSLTVTDQRGSYTLENAILYVGFADPYPKDGWPWEIGTEGDTVIHIHGRNFRDGLVPAFYAPEDPSVTYPCADPRVVSPDEMTAVAPPMPARALNDFYSAVITDGEGGPVVTGREGVLAVYEGTRPPALLSAEPSGVDALGGTVVFLHGENLRVDSSTYVEIVGAGFLFDLVGVSDQLITGVESGIDPELLAEPLRRSPASRRRTSWATDRRVFTSTGAASTWGRGSSSGSRTGWRGAV